MELPYTSRRTLVADETLRLLVHLRRTVLIAVVAITPVLLANAVEAFWWTRKS